MALGELGVALTVLRTIRGWTQEELAKASGVKGSSISDYERDKIIPSLKTLQRLTAAMGYSVAAIERVQSFIYSLRTESWLTEATESAWAAGGNHSSPDSQEPTRVSTPIAPPIHSEALRREVDRVSAEAGKVVSQLTRLLFVMMSSPAPVENRPPGE
jgi:transcriptional regulator with XRE-family HTH domain